MAELLSVGIKGEARLSVTHECTAVACGSGTLEVLATPRLAALMEQAAWESVAACLPEGSTTVGTSLELEHTAPTPVGLDVRVESVLTALDGRQLTFALTAYDSAGEIGRATHRRFIVDAARFAAKASSKLR